MATAKKKAPEVKADTYQYGPYDVGAEVSTPRGVVGVGRGKILTVDLFAEVGPFSFTDDDGKTGTYYQAPEQAHIPVTPPTKMFADGKQIMSEKGASAEQVVQLQTELRAALDKVAELEAEIGKTS